MDQLTLSEAPVGKRCGKCGKVKPPSKFRRATREKDGLQHTCRACRDDAYRNNLRERQPEGTKHCPTCETPKDVAEFNTARNTADGLAAICRECVKWTSREKKYGITHSEFDRMLVGQGGRCAICLTDSPHTDAKHPDGWCVDHDHESGNVRGILCLPCNTGLGSFGDDTDRLSAAAAYLRRHTTDYTPAEINSSRHE